MQPKKIKILHAIRQGLIGGGETHVLDLVKGLDKDKFESWVLSFTDGPMILRLNELGIQNKIIPTTRPFDFRAWKEIKEFLQTEQFNLVHAHGTRAASNLLRTSRSLHIPIVYTVHGWSFHDDQSPWIKKLRIQSEKYISNRTNLNISVSQANQDTGRANFGAYDSQVINNGIDLQKFCTNHQYINLRKQLGIEEGKTLICCPMRMTLQKNPLLMIRALDQVIKQTKDIHLLMVGDGELKQSAIELAQSLGIEEHITFEKFRTDIADVLYSSDIYCLPSLWEGLPIGLLEAMGMGMAAIATKVDGSKEIIEHYKNGVLIEPNHQGQLVEAILHIHHNRSFKKAIGSAASLTIQEHYGVEQMIHKIEGAYSHLVKT